MVALMKDGEVLQEPGQTGLEQTKVEEIREPIITITVFVLQEYLGNITITLCNQKRGNQIDGYHGSSVTDLRDADG